MPRVGLSDGASGVLAVLGQVPSFRPAGGVGTGAGEDVVDVVVAEPGLLGPVWVSSSNGVEHPGLRMQGEAGEQVERSASVNAAVRGSRSQPRKGARRWMAWSMAW